MQIRDYLTKCVTTQRSRKNITLINIVVKSKT